jgi:hypothetical protein
MRKMGGQRIPLTVPGQALLYMSIKRSKETSRRDPVDETRAQLLLLGNP